jgi:hypothetical protein
MSKLKLAGLAVGAAIILFGGDMILRHGKMQEALAGDILKIIDKADPTNTLKPSSVSVPLSIASPIPVASQWDGYFTIAKKDGSAISDQCVATGVPFIVRVVAGGQYGIEIAADDAAKIWECQ